MTSNRGPSIYSFKLTTMPYRSYLSRLSVQHMDKLTLWMALSEKRLGN